MKTIEIGKNIPHDLCLPAMSTALDVEKMKQIFRERLFAAGAQGEVAARFSLQDCRIFRVKLKPGRYCLVCYRLHLMDESTGISHFLLLSARVYPPGISVARLARAEKQKPQQTLLGQSVLHFPELSMLIWVFPNDRKLGALARITDLRYLRRQILPFLSAAQPGLMKEAPEMTVDLVHYVPEHTCTVKIGLYNSSVAPRRARQSEPMIQLYGKTYYNSGGARCFANMHKLWHSQLRRAGHLHIARPLGYHGQTHSLWQMGVPGYTLARHDNLLLSGGEILARAAKAVAALHLSPLPLAQVRPVRSVVKQLHTVSGMIAALQPPYRETIRRATLQLAALAQALPSRPAALLHGDLHLKNFLYQNGRVYLIDLDTLYRGAPALDLGSFAASILYCGLLVNQSEAENWQLIDRFVELYLQAVPWQVSRAELYWHTAAALIAERAFRCLTRLKAGRLDILPKILDMAHQLAGAAADAMHTTHERS